MVVVPLTRSLRYLRDRWQMSMLLIILLLIAMLMSVVGYSHYQYTVNISRTIDKRSPASVSFFVSDPEYDATDAFASITMQLPDLPMPTRLRRQIGFEGTLTTESRIVSGVPIRLLNDIRLARPLLEKQIAVSAGALPSDDAAEVLLSEQMAEQLQVAVGNIVHLSWDNTDAMQLDLWVSGTYKNDEYAWTMPTNVVFATFNAAWAAEGFTYDRDALEVLLPSHDDVHAFMAATSYLQFDRQNITVATSTDPFISALVDALSISKSTHFVIGASLHILCVLIALVSLLYYCRIFFRDARVYHALGMRPLDMRQQLWISIALLVLISLILTALIYFIGERLLFAEWVESMLQETLMSDNAGLITSILNSLRHGLNITGTVGYFLKVLAPMILFLTGMSIVTGRRGVKALAV